MTFVDHVRCYLCRNLNHRAKHYKFPSTLKKCRQKEKATLSKPNSESKGNADNIRQPTKVWKRKKEKQLQ